jgi:hypothetical protein
MNPLTRRFVLLVAGAALATLKAPAATGADPHDRNIRSLVGHGHAARLIASHDTSDRLRGMRLGASLGTAEAVAVLAHAAESVATRSSDPRERIELARDLAPFADQSNARDALARLIEAAAYDASNDANAHAEMARQISAFALANSNTARANESLSEIACANGVGQSAAIEAIRRRSVRATPFGCPTDRPPLNVIAMMGDLGDRRASDTLFSLAAHGDAARRAAALISLAKLSDVRAIELARASRNALDAGLRKASALAFVELNAPERFGAVATLVEDDATAIAGCKLAERVHSTSIIEALRVRANGGSEPTLRRAALAALGTFGEPEAARVLATPALIGDPHVGHAAALALAHSKSEDAVRWLHALLRESATFPNAVRAALVRSLTRRIRDQPLEAALAALSASKDGAERALGVFGRIALGTLPAAVGLDDADARVRRAAATAWLAHPTDASQQVLARLRIEPEDATRNVLTSGLLHLGSNAGITTAWLDERASANDVDAPLAAFALARRVDETQDVSALRGLTSSNAQVRAHTARGLTHSTRPDATGRLANAYAYEADAQVRRAIVQALYARGFDANAPSRVWALNAASELDPDASVRDAANGKLPSKANDSAIEWLTASTDMHSTNEIRLGSFVRDDGFAIPFAFDDSGYALVPRSALAPLGPP